MPREKRHYRGSRIPESKFWELVRYFAEDLSATDVANLIRLTRNSVTNIFLRLRRRMERVSKSSGGSFRRKNIEGSSNFAQHRLQKFNGVPSRTFYLHMKESEWRFNHSDTELYRELLKLIESNPL